MPLGWESADGSDWERHESGSIGSPFGAALVDGRGIVAVGQSLGLETSRVAAWEVAADAAWQAILVEESPSGFGAGVVADADGRLLVVGADGPDGSATVWREPPEP